MYPKLLENLGSTWKANTTTIKQCEEFVCRLYGQQDDIVSIHSLRCKVFRKAKGKMESLPPTQDALVQHIKRANYQRLIWKNALQSDPETLCPTTSGWKIDQSFMLVPILNTKNIVCS